MAGLVEMNSFIGKIVNLWQSGRDASLKIESSAGKASVVLQLELGSPCPQGHPLAARLTDNARSRRRERRAEARKAATAGNVGNNDVTAKETDTAVEAEQQDKQEDVDAEQANIEESNTKPNANVVAEATNANTAVEAVEAKTCELCDKTFGTLKGMRAHIGSQHKAIPQVDGSSDMVNEPTYRRVCKECPNEIETSEDINFHVMNYHEVMAVIENYGQEWASERQYCIRRWSPFEKFFKTP